MTPFNRCHRVVDRSPLAAAWLFVTAVAAWGGEPLSTTFTYQGRLELGASPVNDTADFTFSLWEDPASTDPIHRISVTLNINNVAVADGLFAVALDFGPAAFNGEKRWLQIAVRSPAGSGLYATLSPRQPLTASPHALALPGLHTVPTTASPNIIGGYAGNAVQTGVTGGVIAGGGNSGGINHVEDDYGVVGGGKQNQAGDGAGSFDDSAYATVGGGLSNRAEGLHTTVGGGSTNIASGDDATIAGGRTHNAGGEASTIGGGANHQAAGDYAVVAGGASNKSQASYASVGGGVNNLINSQKGTIGGGGDNTINNEIATISGGSGNTAGGYGTVISGGYSNTASAVGTTIAGGYQNQAIGGGATISGGSDNSAEHSGATIGGGASNSASGPSTTVSGGYGGAANGSYSTIGGGGPSDVGNSSTTNNRATDDYGTIAGGGGNRTGNENGNTTDAIYATIGGGRDNRASSRATTVAGGEVNVASGFRSTIGGGVGNTVSGDYSVIPGGANNTVSGNYSMIAGGSNSVVSGAYSFGAGRLANVMHDGCFLWADDINAGLSSSDHNEFKVRATGGVYFYSGWPVITGVILSPGAGSWTNASSMHLKRDFREVDPVEVLEKVASLDVRRWRYRTEPGNVEHLGPTAEEFHAAFGLGATPEGITGVDADGVALAAIQGLHEIIREKDARITDLTARLERIEKVLAEHPFSTEALR